MRIKTVFLFAFTLLLCACSSTVFQMADGSKRSLDEYSGQWLLINYWAEWCRPCLEEIPELNVLDSQANVKVIGFDYDGSKGEELLNKAKRLGIKFPLIQGDPSSLFSQKEPSGLPATMLIDKDGKFVRWLMGPQTIESIQEAIQK